MNLIILAHLILTVQRSVATAQLLLQKQSHCSGQAGGSIPPTDTHLELGRIMASTYRGHLHATETMYTSQLGSSKNKGKHRCILPREVRCYTADTLTTLFIILAGMDPKMESYMSKTCKAIISRNAVLNDNALREEYSRDL